MAKVIRLDPGGSSTVEESGLSIEYAKERAKYMKKVGEPLAAAGV